MLDSGGNHSLSYDLILIFGATIWFKINFQLKTICCMPYFYAGRWLWSVSFNSGWYLVMWAHAFVVFPKCLHRSFIFFCFALWCNRPPRKVVESRHCCHLLWRRVTFFGSLHKDVCGDKERSPVKRSGWITAKARLTCASIHAQLQLLTKHSNYMQPDRKL